MIEKNNFKFNNIDFHMVKTDKYKTVTGIVSLVKPLNKEDFTYYSLLNRLIGSSSKNYPTKKELSNKMFELYDCIAYMSTSYSYKTVNNLFVFQSVNDKYLNKKNVVKDCVNLLKEIMFNPLLTNEAFDEKNFYEEVRSLENDIKNIYNNKKKYSFRKLMEHMAPNDIISVSTLGDLNILKEITPKSLYDFYLDILNNSWVNIGIIGDVSKEEVENYFNDFHINSCKYNDLHFFPSIVNFKDDVIEAKESQDIVQAKLMIGFRFDIDYQSKYYIPLILFNAMYGGMFGSSLFMTIRERYSLTYDISSELIINKKMLLVSCGVDGKNVDKTSDLVIRELENYRTGNIDSKILNIAKEFLINDLKEMEDSPFGSLSFQLENIINNRPSTNQIIDKIKDVTINDIIEVSKLIKLDTIFTLLPGGNDE